MQGLKLPRVYPILDTASLAVRGIALETAAAALLEGGAGILQIRHKGHWSRAVFDAARGVAALCLERGAVLVIDDRADFARLLPAGLHVGQDDLSPRDARKLIGPDALLGFSTHNAAQLAAAEGEPADYLAIGPIFATGSKLNPDPTLGLDALRSLRGAVSKPLVAIGGITLENAAEVWRAGADSAAVIAGMLPDPATPRSLRERMEQWRQLATTV